MKYEEADPEAQNDEASDDWFCGEKSLVVGTTIVMRHCAHILYFQCSQFRTFANSEL